jgi:hypothetical protein
MTDAVQMEEASLQLSYEDSLTQHCMQAGRPGSMHAGKRFDSKPRSKSEHKRKTDATDWLDHNNSTLDTIQPL